MDVDNHDWKVIETALAKWQAEGKLSAAQAEELKKSINLRKPGQQIARYFFLIALSCTLMAFSAIFIDDKFLERVRKYFDLGHLTIAFLVGAIALSWFAYIRKKQTLINSAAFEVYLVLGGLATLTSLVYICKEIGFGDNYWGFLSIAVILLFSLSIIFRSTVLWIGGIAATLLWFGSVTYNLGNGHAFLGMNYPVRFVLLGAAVLGLSHLQKNYPRLAYSQRISFIAGLLILFTSLWGVSVFGNYTSLDLWFTIRQTHVLGYAFLFGAAALAALYMGIQIKDDMLRDLGILFLLLNFYSRYFEYFWNAMHKGLFFAVLAVSFFFVGRWIERRRKKACGDGA